MAIPLLKNVSSGKQFSMLCSWNLIRVLTTHFKEMSEYPFIRKVERNQFDDSCCKSKVGVKHVDGYLN